MGKKHQKIREDVSSSMVSLFSSLLTKFHSCTIDSVVTKEVLIL